MQCDLVSLKKALLLCCKIQCNVYYNAVTLCYNTLSLLKSSENKWKYAGKFSHEHLYELFNLTV